MKSIAEIIAENLVAVRKKHNLTQNDLAEKLTYSDNTISRWEHAEITPSIETLEKISQIYDVPLESLLKENVSQTIDKQEKTQKVARICTAILLVLSVWCVITALFVAGKTISNLNLWTLFIWAIPISFLIMLPFNEHRIYRFVILTGLTWTFLLACFLEFYTYQLWLVFLCGIPLELALAVWAFIKPKNKKKD
jgi:transcriptional regulator with XRE-family HTH domain